MGRSFKIGTNQNAVKILKRSCVLIYNIHMGKQSPKACLRQGTREWKLLRVLKEIGSLSLDSMLPKQYPEARLWRVVFGIDKNVNIPEERKKELRLVISKTLSRLKEKGLVVKQGTTRNVLWKVTAKSKEVAKENNFLPEDGRLRIVVFDVPESRKYARKWLRDELIAAGYALLQKSVWVGKRPMAESFYNEISDHDLFENVHIFEVKEQGTLMNIDV